MDRTNGKIDRIIMRNLSYEVHM